MEKIVYNHEFQVYVTSKNCRKLSIKLSIIFSVNSQNVHSYQSKNTVTKNNKIQLIIMDIIQSYYTLSSKNNRAELMFFIRLIFHA